jgi:hypothetical protein
LKQRKPSEAIALYRRALNIRTEALGEFHFDVANTLTIMAGVYSPDERNEVSRAELWQRAVEILEQLHANPDIDAPNVAMALRGNLENLATHRYQQSDFAAAETLFCRAIEVTTRAFGAGSAQPCNLPTYAKVLIRQGK